MDDSGLSLNEASVLCVCSGQDMHVVSRVRCALPFRKIRRHLASELAPCIPKPCDMADLPASERGPMVQAR
jgi:hypothetical protein